MNTQEYIESGVLELYALDQCTESERREVERMAALHPEIKKELDSIQLALQEYAHSEKKNPPAFVRENLMKNITHTNEGNGSVVRMKNRNSVNWLAAAAVVLLLGSSVLNVLQYQKNHALKNDLSALRNQNDVFANQLNTSLVKYEESEKLTAMLLDTATKVIVMNGVASTPGSRATVYWNTESAQTFLIANDLGKPDSEHDLQLWAIVDGIPVDAGIIHLSSDTTMLQKMFDIHSPQAFAITIEKKGGSASPTLNQMVVIGNV